jgi:hypothetical protein
MSADPGTSSMGELMALALLSTMAAAVLFQPALMGPPRKAEPDWDGTRQPQREPAIAVRRVSHPVQSAAGNLSAHRVEEPAEHEFEK